MSSHPRHQAVAALAAFTTALIDAEVDLPDLSDGWCILPNGTVLARLRPLYPTELLLLAEALNPTTDPA